MLHLVISFLVAGGSILMVSVGGFLLLSPKDMLFVRYQNFRLSSTGRPLKDEDFPRADRLITTLKISGFFLMALGFMVLALAFMNR